jgi:hypothetical protein
MQWYLGSCQTSSTSQGLNPEPLVFIQYWMPYIIIIYPISVHTHHASHTRAKCLSSYRSYIPYSLFLKASRPTKQPIVLLPPSHIIASYHVKEKEKEAKIPKNLRNLRALVPSPGNRIISKTIGFCFLFSMIYFYITFYLLMYYQI